MRFQPFSQCTTGCTALHIACIHKQPHAVKTLLDLGADLYAQNKKGMLHPTRLHTFGFDP